MSTFIYIFFLFCLHVLYSANVQFLENLEFRTAGLVSLSSLSVLNAGPGVKIVVDVGSVFSFSTGANLTYTPLLTGVNEVGIILFFSSFVFRSFVHRFSFCVSHFEYFCLVVVVFTVVFVP